MQTDKQSSESSISAASNVSVCLCLSVCLSLSQSIFPSCIFLCCSINYLSTSLCPALSPFVCLPACLPQVACLSLPGGKLSYDALSLRASFAMACHLNANSQDCPSQRVLLDSSPR